MENDLFFMHEWLDINTCRRSKNNPPEVIFSQKNVRKLEKDLEWFSKSFQSCNQGEN